ncbi:response regulator [Nostoc sp. NZL]|uniref:response regulator n=1 Tax=Nostoc sp. NZL TaxID=2650612 RepID=UPI0018C62338|nr:response regulator [Nostoc sp. NZL]MBG1243430.1 response regulator [Nostoc sp. NZL]
MPKRVINILVVEDNEVDVMNVKQAFKKVNTMNLVHLARNGLEALITLHSNHGQHPETTTKQHLVLLNLTMPKMGGIEFPQELRSDPQWRVTSGVVMTVLNQDQQQVKAENLNLAKYILKPLTFHKFVEIRATLNKYWILCEMS